MKWSEVEAAVHGIDLGPLKPRLPGGLATADGKIQGAPPLLLAELPRLAERLGAATQNEFVVIGRREVRSNNSWFHNYPRFRKDGDRCHLLIHPADAAPLGVGDGDPVRVRSRVGEIVVPAELSDAIMRGVVSLPHGHGHGRAGVALREAGRLPGASLNDLTDDAEMDPLSTTSVLNGVPVELARA